MSEFDLPKNWNVKLPYGEKREKNSGPNVIKLRDMTRPQVMRWLSENRLVSYKLESE